MPIKDIISGEGEVESIIAALDEPGAVIDIQGEDRYRYRRIVEDYDEILSRGNLDSGLKTLIVAFTEAEAQRIRGTISENIPEAASRLRENVLTCAKSQARQADIVLVVITRESFHALNREALYVALSRGRDGFRLYTDDKAGMLEMIRRRKAMA
jgi:hypothetical protein